MKIISIFLTLFLATIAMIFKESIASSYEYLEPKENEVAIHFNSIEVPLEKILLIRKEDNYCALIFNRHWTENDGKNKFASYKVYYQGDGTGNFQNKNVTITEGMASELPLKGPFRPFIYQPGDSYIKFGPYKLSWNFKKKVGVMPPDKGQGDYGFQLAPTPWTDIKEVNINDPRIKWYRYDEKRERVFIAIDKLWETPMELPLIDRTVF